MTAAYAAGLADALVSGLNGETFSQSFTAARKWYVKPQLEDLSSLAVYVIPVGWSEQPVGRARAAITRVVDVVVLKQADPTSNTAVDPLAYLLDEMFTYLVRRSLADTDSRIWVCGANQGETGARPINPEDAALDPELFRNTRLFAGVIRTTWVCTTARVGS